MTDGLILQMNQKNKGSANTSMEDLTEDQLLKMAEEIAHSLKKDGIFLLPFQKTLDKYAIRIAGEDRLYLLGRLVELVDEIIARPLN